MFNAALYYPTIDIWNEAWLKSAALFWDRIETIVPESEDKPYHRRSTQILQDEGILFAHRINPFCEEVRGIEQDVLKYIGTPEGKKSFVKPRLRMVSAAQSRQRDNLYDINPRDYVEQRLGNTYRDFYIHVGKLPMMLREKLQIEEDEDGYVWASRGFMSFYMTLLANRICKNNRLALLTDRVNQNLFSNRILTDRLLPIKNRSDEQKMKRGMIYQFVMDDIKIDPHTPMDAILQYKKDRCYELDAFRGEMDKLTSFDADGMNLKDLEQEVRRIYTGRVLPSIDAIKATLNDAKINWMSGLGSCVFTGVLPAIIGMGSDIKTNVAIGVCEGIGLALTAAPYILKKNENESSPYSYLIKMRQELSVVRKNENKIY